MSSKSQESRNDKKLPREHHGDAAAQTSGADQVAAQESAEPAPEVRAEPAEPRAAQEAVTRIATLEEEISALRAELSSVNDKYLRKLADEVNFRKRMAREKEDGQRFAVASLLGDLIPVLDDFERAIASSEVAKDYIVLHDGIGLIRRQLAQVLENKYGLKRIESRGQPFDPNFHEAVAVVQGALGAGNEATVDEEFLPAYCLNERVIRTAKVRVRMPAPQGPRDGAAEPAGDAGSGPRAEPGSGGQPPESER